MVSLEIGAGDGVERIPYALDFAEPVRHAARCGGIEYLFAVVYGKHAWTPSVFQKWDGSSTRVRSRPHFCIIIQTDSSRRAS